MLTSGGYFYFTQKQGGPLNSIYILAVNKNNSKTDGVVGFIDFENRSISIGSYQNNKLVSKDSIMNSKSYFENAFINTDNGAERIKVNNYCDELLRVIKLPDSRDSIITIKANAMCMPSSESYSFWGSLLNYLMSYNGGGSSGNLVGVGGTFSNSNYGAWNLGNFGSYGTSGGWGPYDPNNLNNQILLDDSDPNTGFDNNNYISGTDNSTFQLIDPIQPFPLVTDIMGRNNFVSRSYPTQNCLDLAKAQIAKMNYSCGGYDPGGQTFQIYKRASGVDRTETVKGISYIVNALQSNIPVVIGLDYGSPSKNADSTTNHFVVVVGMGSVNGRNYFNYYDNLTSYGLFGASTTNRLYYDNSTGLISGNFTCPGASKFYKIAQIRRSY